MFIKDLIKESFGKKETAIAVGIDVKNAFNSLPWRTIRRALSWRKHFPPYICRIIDDYLSDRWIMFGDINGQICRRKVTSGVPQGSVLGPLLWNLSYDCVLRLRMLPGCTLACYADTLLFSAARTVTEVKELVERQLRRLIPYIESLGLSIFETKTEAAIFHFRGTANYPRIRVGGALIRVGPQLKYLGVILDTRLTFSQHFSYVEAKTKKVLRGLIKLMPNLRGPLETKRRLYFNVVLSILLYGSPVWFQEFCSVRHNQLPFRRIQRLVASRVVCAYRTVFLDAATLLAGFPPINLIAKA